MMFSLIGSALAQASAVASEGTPVVVSAVTAAPSTLTVALTQALIGVITLVIPAMGYFAIAAMDRLRRKWALEATAQNTANMETDLKAANNAGITKALPKIEEKGWGSPEVRDLILKGATAYLQQRFPDRSAEITAAAQPPSGAVLSGPVSSDKAVSETLAARLPDAMAVAAASPATPSVQGGKS